jgi:V-type H+-transporting ATPase subunit C
MQGGLTRWCTVHFGECFKAWVHLKVIRVFVESVLRYGLPVNVTAGVFKVKGEQGGKLMLSLKEAYKHLGGVMGEGEEEEEEEWKPYVGQKFGVEKFGPSRD